MKILNEYHSRHMQVGPTVGPVLINAVGAGSVGGPPGNVDIQAVEIAHRIAVVADHTVAQPVIKGSLAAGVIGLQVLVGIDVPGRGVSLSVLVQQAVGDFYGHGLVSTFGRANRKAEEKADDDGCDNSQQTQGYNQLSNRKSTPHKAVVSKRSGICPVKAIRRATAEDHDFIWQMLEPVIRAGDSYALDAELDRQGALDYWFSPAHAVYVAVGDGRLDGTFYLKACQSGGGAHVANCGYITGEWARGRGVARRMCEFSMQLARQQGYRAMQFNFVIASNTGAIGLWESLGFVVVGRLPQAFLHPRLGLVDALVMHRFL